MTTFFILVSGLSVAFFLVFLWQCGKPRRPAENHGHVIREPEMGSTYSPTGRHSLAHLESQMADFLHSHQRSALVVLLGFVLISLAQRAQSPQLRADQGPKVQQVCETMPQFSSAAAFLADGRETA